MQVSTWDASQMAIALGAIDISSVGGFADGTFIALANDDKYWGYKKGADGTFTRYKILARVSKITFTCQQSSIVNDLLSAAMLSDYNTPGGGGLANFNLKDLNGSTAVSAAHAFIEGPPDADWGEESNDRKWSIVLADTIQFHGGNIPQ